METFCIAICTHNRARRLEKALTSLCMATPPRCFNWEIAVVLNACTDTSADIVQEFSGRLPVFAVVEPRQGLSHARNRAVEACRGDFIIFIDDDVCVDQNFLVAYEAAFKKWPEADVFAGPIVPTFEGSPPDWLERALPAVGSAFGLQRVERDGARIEVSALPYGGNYAIRSSVQKQKLYDPALGRGAVAWLRGGEETELLKAIIGGGALGYWVAAALVEHVIPPDRQTLAHLWRYYEGYGILMGTMQSTQRHRTLSTLSAAVEIASAELIYRAARLVAPPERWAAAMVRAAVRRGKWKCRSLG